MLGISNRWYQEYITSIMYSWWYQGLLVICKEVKHVWHFLEPLYHGMCYKLCPWYKVTIINQENPLEHNPLYRFHIVVSLFAKFTQFHGLSLHMLVSWFLYDFEYKSKLLFVQYTYLATCLNSNISSQKGVVRTFLIIRNRLCLTPTWL